MDCPPIPPGEARQAELAPPGSARAAAPPGATFNTPSQHFVYMTNGTRYRFWMHTSTSADCYNNNMAYLVYGTADETPNNVEITDNASPC